MEIHGCLFIKRISRIIHNPLTHNAAKRFSICKFRLSSNEFGCGAKKGFTTQFSSSCVSIHSLLLCSFVATRLRWGRLRQSTSENVYKCVEANEPSSFSPWTCTHIFVFVRRDLAPHASPEAGGLFSGVAAFFLLLLALYRLRGQKPHSNVYVSELFHVFRVYCLRFSCSYCLSLRKRVIVSTTQKFLSRSQAKELFFHRSSLLSRFDEALKLCRKWKIAFVSFAVRKALLSGFNIYRRGGWMRNKTLEHRVGDGERSESKKAHTAMLTSRLGGILCSMKVEGKHRKSSLGGGEWGEGGGGGWWEKCWLGWVGDVWENFLSFLLWCFFFFDVFLSFFLVMLCANKQNNINFPWIQLLHNNMWKSMELSKWTRLNFRWCERKFMCFSSTILRGWLCTKEREKGFASLNDVNGMVLIMFEIICISLNFSCLESSKHD